MSGEVRTVAANPYEQLLAAAAPVARRVDALENDATMPQTYHLEQLVEVARRLRDVVNAQVAADGPSGPTSLPA